MCVLVAELLGHRLGDLVVIRCFSAGCICQPSIFSPDFTATRTFLPSLVSKRTRVGLAVLGIGNADLRDVHRRLAAVDAALRVRLARLAVTHGDVDALDQHLVRPWA
jgi:hypothetical protein